MDSSPRFLAELAPGESGRITRVGGPAETRNHLLEMGLTRGTTVRLIRVAPLGDPVELLVRGYRLSVRKSEASSVSIEGP
ncbi:MAG: ferrous iron transport protein A [Phycisphaerae bacterium]|nr:ferrous iron transport protein A [Phycisphaerae bacterium]